MSDPYDPLDPEEADYAEEDLERQISEMNAPFPYLVTDRRIPAAAIADGGISFVY